MKKTILSLVAAAVSVAAMAQPEAGKFSIIPRIGVSLAGMSDGGVSLGDAAAGPTTGGGLSKKAGLTVGADIDWQAGRQWSLTLGAYYAQQGCRYGNSTMEIAGSNPKKRIGVSSHTLQMHTLNVPLLVNYYIAPGFAVKTGVQLGLPFSARNKYTTTTYTETDDDNVSVESPKQADEKVNDTMKAVEFAIPIGLSFEYMNVILDARYNIGLTGVQKAEYNDKTKNRVFMFTAAYRFTL